METVYFYDKDLKNCPVKEYLKQYLTNQGDKEAVARRKQKILADIDAKIQHVKDNEGRPTPPISKPLHGYSCFEILNPKDETTVIRILYFRHQEKIVLLHAFEKPAKYDTDKEKKKVDKQNKIGEKHLNSFKLNPENYEKYE
jgi:phage-related protein